MLQKQSEEEKAALLKECRELKAALLKQSEEKAVLLGQCQEKDWLLKECKKQNHHTSLRRPYEVDCKWLHYWNLDHRCAKASIDQQIKEHLGPLVGPPSFPCV